MRYAEGSSHGGVVPQLVIPSLFQSAGRSGLHDQAEVLDELGYAGSDVSCANSDDHALGQTLSGLLCSRGMLGIRLKLSLLMWRCHFCIPRML